MPKRAKKLQELSDILDGYKSDEIEKIDLSILEELVEEVSKISDTRDSSYVRHSLGDIIMITLLAVMANANEWLEIELFAKKKEKWLRKFLRLENGIPTDDTIRIVVSSINVEYLYSIVVSFLMEKLNGIINTFGQTSESESQEILSCDGKVSKSSKRNNTETGGSKALNTLNVYSSNWGFCLEQEFIEEKTNEIPTTPEVLKRMDLRGSIVTWDALNTQKETVAAVVKGKGDYVGALKGNQGNLYDDVKLYFDKETISEMSKSAIEEGNRLKNKRYKKTVEKEHSGIVTREYFIENKIEWLSGKKDWAGLKAIGLEHKTILKNNSSEPVYEDRFYICSFEDIDNFARAVRDHWGVENGLHWHLDFTFKDDNNTTMRDNGAKGLQIFKKIALALLKVAQVAYPKRTSLKSIRYRLSLGFDSEIEKIFSMLSVNNLKEVLKMD